MPTLIAMHHPPLATGVPAMDTIGIDADERRELEEILSAPPPRPRHRLRPRPPHDPPARWGRRRRSEIPSTDMQLALDFSRRRIAVRR